MNARDREGLRALSHAVHELSHAVGILAALKDSSNATGFAGSAIKAARQARELFDTPPSRKRKRK